jgi:uncharacterized protein (DUF1800 family)
MRSLIYALNTMAQRPFNAGSPAGYSALNDGWAGSDALMKRIDWVARLSQYVNKSPQKIVE